jgi:nitrate/nitrite-specific signal transduction histidine kinase
MRERAQTIGANLDIESHLGHGTRVSVTWPGAKNAGSRVDNAGG